MFWLPVAFVCFTNLECVFYSGNLSISVDQCKAQNNAVKKVMEVNSEIKAYQTECLEIEPKMNDSL